MCFACGRHNPIGLKLNFEWQGERYVTRFLPKPEHQGYAGIVHGGILSTLLDEAMARLAYVKGYDAVTAEMALSFRKPVYVGEQLTISGWINSKRGRILLCSAEARNEQNELVATAKGKLFVVGEADAERRNL